jgi:hypothetical protein
MTTTTKILTPIESFLIADAARRRIVGAAWDDLDGTRLKDRLQQAIAAGHSDRLEVLLALVDGVRYDLCDEDQQTLRKATVVETIDSLMAGPEGWIKVGLRQCYADLS